MITLRQRHLTFLIIPLATIWITLPLVLVPTVHVRAQPPTPCAFGDIEVPIAGISGSICDYVNTTNTPLLTYTAAIINIVLGLIVVIGVITIIVAGYFYMTAGGSAVGIQFAKTLLVAALSGIILALTAWLILNTISPQFASYLQEPQPGAGGGGGGGSCTPPTPGSRCARSGQCCSSTPCCSGLTCTSGACSL